ncbi:efflux RND transporter periplasmic adaptor subunit [Alcaligenes sp. WGS1538]|uniref:efflux RND transporter periplasmic adaptor subunit n=1 Tax=Alcaligenes sp. WGS1538 TaxID=3366811 RepID=UPI00372D0A25
MSAAASIEAALLGGEQRCRQAADVHELAFTIVNETWQIWPYRQAQLWQSGPLGPQCSAISGLAVLPEDSPFTVWSRRLVRALAPGLGQRLRVVNFADIAVRGAPSELPMLTPELIAGWEEWWPPYLVLVPLLHQDKFLGVALFLLDEPPPVAALQVFARLQLSWSYCLWALTPAMRRKPWLRLPRGQKCWIAAALALLALCIPVRQSALAPAEIVPSDGTAVASPLDGVIKTFHVAPNQMVKTGEPLYSLDDTTLRNRREITARALEVAAAELLSAQQRAFADPKASSEIAVLQGRIAERRAELQAVQEQLSRIDVTASRDGVAVFTDIDDWQGKPVVTGERIMQLADPKDISVRLFLPVADAIALEPGADIRVFLDVAPLSPLAATLVQTSYQSVLSADGIASYSLRGRLLDREHARIGLKGTAKVYGEKVPLVYYLLRRPLAALRQWSGL